MSVVDFWDCPYFEYDETYIEETGECWEFWGCDHSKNNDSGCKLKMHGSCPYLDIGERG